MQEQHIEQTRFSFLQSRYDKLKSKTLLQTGHNYITLLFVFVPGQYKLPCIRKSRVPVLVVDKKRRFVVPVLRSYHTVPRNSHVLCDCGNSACVRGKVGCVTDDCVSKCSSVLFFVVYYYSSLGLGRISVKMK